MTLRPLLGSALPLVLLADDEIAVLAALDEAIEQVIAPLAQEHDAAGRYPSRSITALKLSGALGLSVPKDLGGVGASHRASLEAQVRLAIADSAVAQIFKVHDELVREITVYCPPSMRQPFADRVLDHHHIIGLAVAEAGRTVDAPWQTVVLPTGDGFVLDGEKIYTTGAAEADEVAVWAFNPTVDGVDTNALLGFQLGLVPSGTAGMTVRRDWDALGQRATDSGSISFAGVAYSEAQRASEPGGAPLPQNAVRYQAGFAAVLVGIGLGALRAAIPFAATRSRPWPSAVAMVPDATSAADDPMVRRLCGELASELVAAYHATIATGDLLDAYERGDISRTELAIPIYAAKAAANNAALHATSEIFAMLGTRGVAASNGFDRFWRNARTLSLHDPVDWKHEEIGHHLLTGWDPPPGIYT